MKTLRVGKAMWAAALVALVLLAARPAPAGEPAGPALRLSEAVKTALEKHPALRAAGHQAEAAASGVDQARAGFLPRVDFSEGFARSDNPVYAFGSLLNQGRFTAADFAVDKLNHPDPITNWRTNLSGSVPLFLGGRAILGYQQAQLGQSAAEQGRLRAEHEVIFGVIRAYSAVLLSREALSTVQISLRTAEANLAACPYRRPSQ